MRRHTVRICSFLPSATEIVFELELGDALFGVTHECDYPPEAREKSVVVTGALRTSDLTSKEIEESIAWHVGEGKSLYLVDRRRLKEADPDVIITQELCKVCAPSTNEVAHAVSILKKKPKVISLNPLNLDDIVGDILTVGKALDRPYRAEEVVNGLRERIARVSQACINAERRPRIFSAEWLEPPYSAGHWVPEIVELAGGYEGMAKPGKASRRLEWREIEKYDPELLVIMPCGYDAKKGAEEFRKAGKRWNSLRAVSEGRAYAVDANSYFSRPGPRIVTGLEILANIIHPELFTKEPPKGSVIPLGRETKS